MTVAVALSGAGGHAAGPLGRWLDDVALPVIAALDPDRALLLAGVLMIQLSSGNVLVRLVLAVTHTLNPVLGWVLTTLDKVAQEAAVGPASVVQIVLGKPYGLDEVVAAVRQSLLRDGRGQDGHGRDGQALDGQIHDGHDGNTLTRDWRPLAQGPFG